MYESSRKEKDFSEFRHRKKTNLYLRQKKRNCPLLPFLRKLQVDACVRKQTFFFFFVFFLFSGFVGSRFRFIFIAAFILDRKLLLGFSLLRHRKKRRLEIAPEKDGERENVWPKRVGLITVSPTGEGVFEPFYFQTLARFHHKNMNVEPLSQP